MNPDAGGIVIPALDGVLGPITSQALNMSRLANIVKTMQALASAAPAAADSFHGMNDALKNLGKQVHVLKESLKVDLPPTTAEVRMQRLNLARIVRNRG